MWLEGSHCPNAYLFIWLQKFHPLFFHLVQTLFCLVVLDICIHIYLWKIMSIVHNLGIFTHLSCGLIKQIISSNVGGYGSMKAWYKPVEYTPLSTCISLPICNKFGDKELAAVVDLSNCTFKGKNPSRQPDKLQPIFKLSINNLWRWFASRPSFY
jgi:hypothetical protein